MKSKKLEKVKWYNFISGQGLQRVIDATELMKQVLYKRYFKYNRSPENLILGIRLEMMQINKHQKVCMKYLQELEMQIRHK